MTPMNTDIEALQDCLLSVLLSSKCLFLREDFGQALFASWRAGLQPAIYSSRILRGRGLMMGFQTYLLSQKPSFSLFEQPVNHPAKSRNHLVAGYKPALLGRGFVALSPSAFISGLKIKRPKSCQKNKK